MKLSSLGQRIVYYRKVAGISQKNLAKAVGIMPPALSHYEKNKREPNVAIIKKIAKVLNITGDALLGLDPQPDLVAQNHNEYVILNTFRKLNNAGQKRAQENVSDLSEVPKYVRC